MCPVFNIHNLETFQAVVDGAFEMKPPVIITIAHGTILGEIGGVEDNIVVDEFERLDKMNNIIDVPLVGERDIKRVVRLVL